MSKLYLSDLADVLVDKHGLTKKDASKFISVMVEVIQEAVTNDKMVKIKGLGTFKVIDVDARESVSVNTGERVLIDGHQKLTFVPDNAMKELVNKPFSQFETVILNEGVTFDDMSGDETPEPAEAETETVTKAVEEEPVPEPQPVEDEPVPEPEPEPEPDPEPEPIEEEPEPEPEPEPDPEPEPEPEPEPVEEEPEPEPEPAEEEPEPEPDPEEPVSETTEDTDEPEMPIEEPQQSGDTRNVLRYVLVLLACGLCFGAGYYFGRNSTQTETDKDVVDTETAATQTKTDSLKITETDSVPQAVQQPEEPRLLTEEDYKRYDEMDARVRTGAYYIVGTDQVLTVKEGDNIGRIARRTIGAGMECYIEVYNGIDRHTALSEGQEIKIPKLRTKTSVRRELRNKEKERE